MYTLELRQLGISLYEGMEKTVMSTIKVGDIMRTNLLTIRENLPLKQIIEIFFHTRFTTMIVVNEGDEMVGKLHLDDLKRLVETPYLYNVLIASEIMEAAEPIVQNESLTKAVEILGQKHSSLIPVVAQRGSLKPIGYITRKDVLNVYQKEILRKNLSGFSFRSPVSEISDTTRKSRHAIDFSDDYSLESIPAGNAWKGKTVQELQLRKLYGITILAILSPESDNHILPTPEYVIQKEDRLVIAGPKANVETIRATRES